MENQNYPEYNVNKIQEVEIFDNDLAKLIDDIETDKKKKKETALKNNSSWISNDNDIDKDSNKIKLIRLLKFLLVSIFNI